MSEFWRSKDIACIPPILSTYSSYQFAVQRRLICFKAFLNLELYERVFIRDCFVLVSIVIVQYGGKEETQHTAVLDQMLSGQIFCPNQFVRATWQYKEPSPGRAWPFTGDVVHYSGHHCDPAKRISSAPDVYKSYAEDGYHSNCYCFPWSIYDSAKVIVSSPVRKSCVTSKIVQQLQHILNSLSSQFAWRAVALFSMVAQSWSEIMHIRTRSAIQMHSGIVITS